MDFSEIFLIDKNSTVTFGSDRDDDPDRGTSICFALVGGYALLSSALLVLSSF